MFSIQDLISQQLGGDALSQISRQIGADEGTTANAIQAALPMLIGALARNTSSPEGASALSSALDRDHDGSVLDDVISFVGGASAGPGNGILRHIFGDRRPAVEEGLSQNTGLNTGAIAQLLITLAPLVLGALGKAKSQQGLDPGGLSDLLQNERQQAESAGSPMLDMLSGLLDSNRDGQVMDDLARMAGNFLGNRRS